MRKLFLGALGLLALASCSNDELTSVNRDGDEISFSVVTNSVSRASDIYCNANPPGAFKVWAKCDGAFYIKGDNVEKQGGNWVNTSSTRYWPADQSKQVTFFAYYNDNDKFSWENVGTTPTIPEFEVPVEVGSQKDLIYAVKAQAKPENGQVSLNFRHALSQIVFQAKNTNEKLLVKISGVSVCNVKNQGTFTFPTNNTDTNLAHGNSLSIDSYDGSWGAWSSLSGAQTYAVTFSEVEVSGNSTAVSLTNTNNKPDGSPEFSSNAMLLLPQTSTAWTPNGSKPAEQAGTYFLVKCQIYNIVDIDTKVCLWGLEGAADVAIPVALNWTQGKKYIYTFVFGAGNGGYDPENPSTPVLVPITFNVTVDEFVPATNEDINMDKTQP